MWEVMKKCGNKNVKFRKRRNSPVGIETHQVYKDCPGDGLPQLAIFVMNVMLIGKMMMDMMDHRNLGYPISTTTHVWSQWRTEPKSPDVNSGSPVDKRLCEKIVRTHQQKMVPPK